MVNSHITVIIIIFQPGFLEMEMLEVCTLFELVEIESAKSVNFGT